MAVDWMGEFVMIRRSNFRLCCRIDMSDKCMYRMGRDCS
jgi:hypothetical protein